MTPANEKAIAIFREIVGERSEQLIVAAPAAKAAAREALCGEFDRRTASDIGFHMMDWNHDAAFITAFLLYPERFTGEEIREGIENFLIHAPNHLAAAAKLFGYPIQDTFEVGALDGEP
ncbi:MAG: hypothetical protein EOP09_13670 [Proteobacteria bacterium]|nr:MAG: hypothetical protein EOP09_13670 [Pseudomonadota bacterium]